MSVLILDSNGDIQRSFSIYSQDQYDVQRTMSNEASTLVSPAQPKNNWLMLIENEASALVEIQARRRGEVARLDPCRGLALLNQDVKEYY